jgi:hypothetical protein
MEGGAKAPRGLKPALQADSYFDIHCIEKLEPSDDGLDGTASCALVLPLTMVMAITSAPGKVLKAPLCELSTA